LLNSAITYFTRNRLTGLLDTQKLACVLTTFYSPRNLKIILLRFSIRPHIMKRAFQITYLLQCVHAHLRIN